MRKKLKAMLYEILKLVTYLSILTTTTSSSYIAKESLVNYRRASPSSSIASEQSPHFSNDGEGYEWAELSSKVESSQPQSDSDYLMPQLVNVNNMLYTQIVNADNSKNPKKNNNRKISQRSRGKKDNNNKLINSKNNKLTNLIKNYDNLSMKNNVASSYSDESNNVRNTTDNVRTIEDQNYNKYNLTNNSRSATGVTDGPPTHRTSSSLQNEYPINQISTESEHDRELQQLFGIEGAKKYQSYQLQQQLLKNNEQFPFKSNDEGVEMTAPQKKRNGDMNAEEMQDVSGAMTNQIMPRATRRQREYDVPLIQCPPATDGMERFACPTPDRQGRYRCIDDHVLCDGFIDCPEGADEDRQACMFYKTTKAHLDVLADALLRWARGR